MPSMLAKPVKLIPLARLVAAAQIIMLARRHWHRLEPAERHRVVVLLSKTHGRRRNLSANERLELARLVAKADPRLFAGLIAQRFSPVPLPGRVVRGRRRA